MTDYIPLQEFADRVGISRQAVSKNKQLAPYIRDTKPKTISTEALSLFANDLASEPTDATPDATMQPPMQPDNATLQTQPTPTETTPDHATDPQPSRNLDATAQQPYETLSATLTYLTAQLAEKDRIIAEKDEQIRDLTEKIADLAEKSHDVAEKSVTALQQRNFLEAQSQLPPPEKSTIFTLFRKKV